MNSLGGCDCVSSAAWTQLLFSAHAVCLRVITSSLESMNLSDRTKDKGALLLFEYTLWKWVLTKHTHILLLNHILLRNSLLQVMNFPSGLIITVSYRVLSRSGHSAVQSLFVSICAHMSTYKSSSSVKYVSMFSPYFYIIYISVCPAIVTKNK